MKIHYHSDLIPAFRYRQALTAGAVFCFWLTVQLAVSQTPMVWDPANDDPQYEARKQNLVQPVKPEQKITATPSTLATPACFEPFSNTGQNGWIQAPRNDDGSFGPVALGWNFSLFGTIYDKVYINTNGNITFNSSLTQYTPNGFPISTPMVAAFWADVDTRNTNSGAIWYKVFSDRLVVTWDHVGYYNQQVDKTNTFQMTIKANTAAGFTGDDVIFAYDDMQWTTGSASSGVSGFGGAAATVGANRGNNIDYIQTGRFNINSAQAPNIPTAGSLGGIDWLDGKCIGYQVRGGTITNIPPSVAGLPANNTITLGIGDTRNLLLQFSGPEVSQNVTVTSNLNSLCNGTVVFNGNNSPNPSATFTIIGGTCNVGTKTISFTATDNGTPAASQTFSIQVTVVNPCPTMVVLNNITDDFTGGTTIVKTMASNGSIVAANRILNPGTKATYQSRSILLNPGFRADKETVFKAEPGGCI